MVELRYANRKKRRALARDRRWATRASAITARISDEIARNRHQNHIDLRNTARAFQALRAAYIATEKAIGFLAEQATYTAMTKFDNPTSRLEQRALVRQFKHHEGKGELLKALGSPKIADTGFLPYDPYRMALHNWAGIALRMYKKSGYQRDGYSECPVVIGCRMVVKDDDVKVTIYGPEPGSSPELISLFHMHMGRVNGLPELKTGTLKAERVGMFDYVIVYKDGFYTVSYTEKPKSYRRIEGGKQLEYLPPRIIH